MSATRMAGWGTLALVLLAGLCGCGEPAPDVMIVERLRDIRCVAVAPLTDGPGVNGVNSGEAVAGLIINGLMQVGRLTVAERSQMKRVLDERNLQSCDLVDQSKAIEVGRLIGADAIVTGSVNEYDSDKSVVYIDIIPIVTRSFRVGASIRVVDVRNGEIIYSHSMGGSSGKDYTEAGRQAVEKLLNPMLTALAREKPVSPSRPTAERTLAVTAP